jgi:hypothetical protein
MAEMNPTPLTDDFADPVSIGAGTISLGDTVSYTDLDGGTGQGLVVSIVPDDPTREGGVSGWLLEVMPDGAEGTVMVMPADAKLVEGTGSAEAAVVSDNIAVQDSSTSEAAMPDLTTPPVEGAPPAIAPGFIVVEQSQECMDSSGGTLTVAVVGGDGIVESCHVDAVAAQARVDELAAAMPPVVVEEPEVVEDPMVGEPMVGMSDEERAADLAEKVREVLNLLAEAEGSFGDGDGTNTEPNPLLEVEGLQEFAVAQMADDGLAGLSDDDLITELARRWASDLVNRLTNDGDAVNAYGDEIEVEINLGDGEESEGKYPEGCEMCPMCEGGTEITINGVTAVCPECAGEGYITSEPSEPMEAEMPSMEDLLMPMADEEGVTAAGEPQPVPTTATYDWEGVLIVEGLPSGDGRMIAEEALSWRELPIPLMLQTVNAPGHDGAVICGSIHEIVREGQNVLGRGYFDSGEAGTEARRLLSEGTMRGVSADIDSVIVEFMSPEGTEVSMEDMMFGGVDALEVLVDGRIMGATLTPFPAFQEAHVSVIGAEQVADSEVLVASGAIGDVWQVPSPLGAWTAGEGDAEGALASLVASAGKAVDVPVNPPRAWFEPGDMEKPEPFTVHADGRVYGLVARWGSCHIGFTDRCVNVPKSGSAYKHFRNKNVLTAEGDLVATGPVFMDTVHPDLRLKASDTQAFYADTGCAVADVALYENEFGIVAAGAVRPGMTPEQMRRFRGSDVSPDWRQIKGRLEVVGLLSVNVSGFIVEGLVASGATVSNPRGVWDSAEGDLTTLVAAGMIRHSQTEAEEFRAEFEALKSEVAAISEAVRPIRAQRAAERFAALAAAFGGEKADTHDCGGSCGGSDGVCACGS